MLDIGEWGPPQKKGIHAAFRYAGADVVAISDFPDNEETQAAAQATFAVWKAAKKLPDAAFAMIKSAGHLSLVFANGGVVVEGEQQLNVGILRSSTKSMEPVPTPLTAHRHLQSDDRFRRVIWAIMARVQGTVLPRSFVFNLAGTNGTVTVADAMLTLAGDFQTPEDFVAEIRAATEIKDDLAYSLAEQSSSPDAAHYPVDSLLHEIVAVSGDGACTFDAEGWPQSRGAKTGFGAVQTMHDCLYALKQHPAHDGQISISILSDSNATLLKGTLEPNGSATFHI